MSQFVAVCQSPSAPSPSHMMVQVAALARAPPITAIERNAMATPTTEAMTMVRGLRFPGDIAYSF